jgi:hypothetical protein
MSILRDPKRLVATILAGVVGLFVLADFGGVAGPAAVIAAVLINWAAIITAVALLIGIVSVASSHVQRVRHRNADWPYSLVLLLGLLSVIGAGIFFPLPTSSGFLFPESLAEVPIRTFFRTVYEPLAASLLALLAFFSLSAALRALGRGTREAQVIVIIAVVVLIVQLPFMSALPGVGPTVEWLNNYVAVAGARGLLIGSAIGALVASVRVLIGFDMPYVDR